MAAAATSPSMPSSSAYSPSSTRTQTISSSPDTPRPYPAHLPLAPTPLRPHCMARERLLLWLPLTSRTQKTGPVSVEDLQRVADVMAWAWAESTLETYGSGLLIYHVFCDVRNIREFDRAPASEQLIKSWVAALAGSYSADAVSNFVAAVQAWHALHGLTWAIHAKDVTRLIKATRALAPPPAPKRKPYTPSLMSQLRRPLDLSLPLDAAVWACMTTTFYTMARLGEFVVPNLAGFDPKRHVTRSHITTKPSGDTVMTVFHLPATKAAPEHGEDVYWLPEPDGTDPLRALLIHFAVNNPLILAAHDVGAELGPAHGLRIGSNVLFLLRGVPFEAVKQKGRLKSEAFTLYLRNHAEIMVPYFAQHPDIQEQLTRISLPPVRGTVVARDEPLHIELLVSIIFFSARPML
ncbi:hypothetical protein EV122DRAFT_294635 [Schizophyllum commune]